MLEMSAQIVGECQHRGVAFGRRFVHRARQNVVEIAGECAREPGRRGAACDRRRLRVQRGRLAGPRRLGMQHGVFDLDRVVSSAIGSRAGQQNVQQHTQRVDIGRGRDGLAQDLFGRRVFGCEDAAGHARQVGTLEAGIRFEQLGDAEVEQLHLAFRGDQDVGRLDVTMDYEVGMRLADGRAHIEKQTKSCFHSQLLFVAPGVDADAAHVLEHQVDAAVGCTAGIEQSRDVGVRKAAQDLGFTQKPFTQMLRR